MTDTEFRLSPADSLAGQTPAKSAGYVYPLVPELALTEEHAQWLDSKDLSVGRSRMPANQLTWWTIEAWGFEQCRSLVGDPVPEQSPSTGWESGSGDSPPGGVYPGGQLPTVRSTHLQLRLRYTNNARFSRVIDIDIGAGIRVAILAPYVRVGLLLPKGAKPKKAGRGAALDAIPEGACECHVAVAGRITGSASMIGSRAATRTRTVSVQESEVRAFQRAAGSVAIQVFQDTPVAAGPFDFLSSLSIGAGNAAVFGPSVGQLDFIAGMRHTFEVAWPATATHLATQQATDARRFTIVERLEL